MSHITDILNRWTPGVPSFDGENEILYIGPMGNLQPWRLIKKKNGDHEFQALLQVGDCMPCWVEGGWSYKECAIAAASIANTLGLVFKTAQDVALGNDPYLNLVKELAAVDTRDYDTVFAIVERARALQVEEPEDEDDEGT